MVGAAVIEGMLAGGRPAGDSGASSCPTFRVFHLLKRCVATRAEGVPTIRPLTSPPPWSAFRRYGRLPMGTTHRAGAPRRRLRPSERPVRKISRARYPMVARSEHPPVDRAPTGGTTPRQLPSIGRLGHRHSTGGSVGNNSPRTARNTKALCRSSNAAEGGSPYSRLNRSQRHAMSSASQIGRSPSGARCSGVRVIEALACLAGRDRADRDDRCLGAASYTDGWDCPDSRHLAAWSPPADHNAHSAAHARSPATLALSSRTPYVRRPRAFRRSGPANP